MDDQKWARFAALGGVAFVILNVVGGAVAGQPPAPDDSAAKITEWFVDHDSGIALSQLLGGLGSVGLVWWAGTLWRRLSDAEHRPRLAVVSMLGLAMSGALYLTANGILAAVAMRIDEIGDGSQVFYALSSVMLSAAGFFVAVHVGSASALALRTRTLPTWLAWLGAVDALAFLVAASIGSASDSAASMAIGVIAFIAWGIWILGTSVTMWRDQPMTAAVAA